MTRIALDAMGGDHAPRVPVSAALLALPELDSSDVIQLVGKPDAIQAALDEAVAANGGKKPDASRLTTVAATEVIEMSDKPTAAVRGKPDSSMTVGLKLQATGGSDAFVSAGNTGAQMAASTVLFRLHSGLTRPAIATIFPTARKPVVVLDAGANVDCSAQELVQFARLGDVYAEDILGRDHPAIGLLSVGEEPEKGSAAVKEAHQMLREAGLNFLGNVEGRDIARGECGAGAIDVVVCDGFTGNVLLKFYETIAPFLVGLAAKHAGRDPRELLGGLKELDYAEYGGAPLLGVKGVSIICHGRSSARAIKNAILVAKRAVTTDMNTHIGRRLAEGAAAPEPA
ncbi:MAG TPA: phosphate acyltransferase PlsX [Gemmatimonadaceae bacterium]|nr:phosphate acyltransferase PlsX [Gemmatimonadaceae bacterium]